MLLEIASGNLSIGFDREHGGLPAYVAVQENDGRKTTVFNSKSWGLQITLANGRILHPVLNRENIQLYDDEYCTHVDMINIHFVDELGADYPEHYLTYRHEFYPDGTAFTNMFFFVRDVNAVGITKFELAAKPDFSDFDALRWSCRERPLRVDGTLITAQTERFIPPGSKRNFAQILPLAGFNLTRKFAPSLYCELFVEGQSTLSNDPGDSETVIGWNGLSPEITWSFQKDAFPKPLINQLRNQWGWCIRPAAGTRTQPPMQMYHYFDNYERYPSSETIAAVAATGCDIFVMHENWRSDTQNDGIPLDYPAFIQMKDALHAAGIRLAVYIRGCEESVVMRQAQWFKNLLTYNFDGLYMDYGGPFSHSSAPSELFCGGRINFREHYRVMRALREEIGPDGIFFSHTGPSFSAISMPFMSGYVSGEGERGMLISGREEYEYYSMAAVCPGTLWSAAFPEYASSKIIPFIASTGQYPHNCLGEQFASSSLVHPRVPGINDREFIPIWKLWSILKRERDLRVVNDINSSGVFACDPATGHCMYIAKSGDFALAIFGSFKSEKAQIDSTIDLERAGFKCGKFQIRLLADGKVSLLDRMPSTLQLAGCAVAGLLLTAPEVSADSLLVNYLQTEPELSPCGKAYLARVEEQRIMRQAPQWEKTYLRIVMPDLTPTPYEDSMTVDLFDNAFALVKLEDDGSYTRLCYIDKEGISPTLRPELNLFCSDRTPAICLNDFGLKGPCKLAVYTTHAASTMPFYIFCYVDLAPDAEFTGEFRRLEFLNDIEPDRAYINFTCSL